MTCSECHNTGIAQRHRTNWTEGYLATSVTFCRCVHGLRLANAAGLAEIRNMPFGGAAQSGEGRSGAGEREAATCANNARVGREGEQLREALSHRGSMSVVAGGGQKPFVKITFGSLALAYAASDALHAALNARQSGEGEREDWVAHDGGDCPVDPAATVEIKLRDGSVTTMTAKAVNWRYGTYIFEAHRTMPAFCEVVAYRLRAGEA